MVSLYVVGFRAKDILAQKEKLHIYLAHATKILITLCI